MVQVVRYVNGHAQEEAFSSSVLVCSCNWYKCQYVQWTLHKSLVVLPHDFLTVDVAASVRRCLLSISCLLHPETI